MSDPVTNVEIEDVLSSIRRLVSDGDKARTRDPVAPAGSPEVPTHGAQDQPESRQEWPPAAPLASEPETDNKTDKLVLTPAFLVVDRDEPQTGEDANTAQSEGEDARLADDPQGPAPQVEQDQALDFQSEAPDTSWADAPVAENAFADDSDTANSFADDAEEGPLALTDMVFDGDADGGPTAAAAGDRAEPAARPDVGDRSELVATIAELEAAISKNNDEFEPDGSEELSETIVWPGSAARRTDNIEDAQSVDTPEAWDLNEDPPKPQAPIHTQARTEPAPDMEDEGEDDTIASFESARAAPKESVQAHTAPQEHAPQPMPEPTLEEDVATTPEHQESADVYRDDDLEELLETGALNIDQEALRALVSDVVREELSGPLGERITRNVRKLVRREIYRILSSQEFD